jgi:hypothetical protein
MAVAHAAMRLRHTACRLPQRPDRPKRRRVPSIHTGKLVADELGIGHATVSRAWKQYGVQPWRAETFKFSTDPALEARVRDVVGFYPAPPHNAVVLCVDELGRAEAR